VAEYNVHHTGYVSHVETVEADSPEEAIELSEVGSVSLCHQCTREWDSAGDPDIFNVTDAAGEVVWEQEAAPQPVFDREALRQLVAYCREREVYKGRDNEIGADTAYGDVADRLDDILALVNGTAK
jgi:hypothetical protein